jgi:hypothetical protein
MYSTVVDYYTFSKFKILKHSDHDVLSKEWATLANRQAANKYFKIERAEEEIHHCNVEVARVQAWVDEDDVVMSRAVADHKVSDPPFAAHLKVLQDQRRHVNNHLRKRLEQIYKLPGYSGPPHIRVAASSAPPLPSAVQSTTLKTGVKDRVDDDHIDDEIELRDDEDEDEMLRMADTLVKIMV